MGDAQVRFSAIYGADDAEFGFRCLKGKGRCEGLIVLGKTGLKYNPQREDGGIPQWSWDGNKDMPTFCPSINCNYCGWHGFIEKGRCVDTQKQDEPEVA